MPPCQCDSGTYEHIPSGSTVTTKHSSPMSSGSTGNREFVVSTQKNSIALGLEDTHDYYVHRHGSARSCAT